ncbi:4517_t:CDS:1, partial [Entrophospora sp. SA101]
QTEYSIEVESVVGNNNKRTGKIRGRMKQVFVMGGLLSFSNIRSVVFET